MKITLQPLRTAAVAAICLALAGTTVLGEGPIGTVLTRDGKTYFGHVELKTGNQVAVTPTGGTEVTLSFQNVIRLTLSDEATSPAPVAADPHLSLPWQQRDIGRVKLPGSGTESKGLIALQAAGWGIWGGADSFHFVYQALRGDGDIKARLVEVPTDENAFLAGLTIRAGFEADSPEASVMLRPNAGPRVNCRPINPGRQTPELHPQRWVRLVRAGDTFAGYSSRDGTAWEPVGTVKVKMTGPVYAGLACAATANQDLVAAAFDQVSVCPAEGGGGPAAGLGLVDGSLLAGVAQECDGKTIKYLDSHKVAHTLPAEAVAYIFSQPLPADLRGVLPGGNLGIWFFSGDVLEGQVQKLSNGKFTVNSLVLGPQNIEYGQVLTALLRPVKTVGACTVTTRDGTIYRCQSVAADDAVVTAQGGVIGSVRVNMEDLAGIRFTEVRP
jgi:hypothetical protein